MKQRQQKELAENIINKITKELENPKTLNQILQQSVADVERKCSCSPCFPAFFFLHLGILEIKRNMPQVSFLSFHGSRLIATRHSRNRGFKGAMNSEDFCIRVP